MSQRAGVDERSRGLDGDGLPETLASGQTLLVACPDAPAPYAVDLRALCTYGSADDTSLVVTTTESAERTIETYERLCPAADRGSLKLVDTTSEQYLTAVYDETPVICTPSPDDLERLVIGLSDLTEENPPAGSSRHLVVRSLTPLLESTSTDRVCTVLDRITGLRSEDGFCFLGIDYTAHDRATLNAVSEQVDGVLWATRSSAEGLDVEYRPSVGRYDPS